jgi:hypothetical protein
MFDPSACDISKQNLKEKDAFVINYRIAGAKK